MTKVMNDVVNNRPVRQETEPITDFIVLRSNYALPSGLEKPGKPYVELVRTKHHFLQAQSNHGPEAGYFLSYEGNTILNEGRHAKYDECVMWWAQP